MDTRNSTHMIESKDSLRPESNITGTPQLLSGFRSPSPRLRTFNLLSSPTKITINNHNHPAYLKSSPEVNDGTTDKEFAELSTQLSSLLKELSEIYTEIGYSKPEIEKNEKSLFDLVSHTFDKFLSDSKAYRLKLNEENTRMITILRAVLKTINDPSGTRTIPDLYLRNLILKDTQQGTTLLKLKKCLESTLESVLKDYRDRLMKYLQHSQSLNMLILRVDGFILPEDITIPSLNHTMKILRAFEQHSSTRDIYDILVSESALLLENESLNHLSDDRFTKMSQVTSQLKSEVSKRLSSLKETSKAIMNLWNELKIDHKNEYFMISDRVVSYCDSSSNSEDLDISTAIMSEFTKQLEDLRGIKVEREALLQDYHGKCKDLWTKLKEDSQSVQSFTSKHRSLSIESIEAYDAELERLHAKKKEFMKEFIFDARAQISDLWEQLCFSDEERGKFIAFNEEVYTDEILSQYEEEITRLTNIYNSYSPILDLIQDFNTLLEDRANLEESTRDSSRLLSRNSHKILMEEEKTRKRLTRQLPRVVGDLNLKISEFEEINGPLTFLSTGFIAQLNEEQKKLESKGRRVLSGSRSRVPSAAPSRATSRAPSRVPSAAPSRAASRAASRMPSRQPSRSTSPIKANPTISARQPVTRGIHKPERRPLTNKPTLTASKSCVLPPLCSPTRETTLSITSEMMKEKRQLRTPAVLTRSHSSFQPQLSRLPEANLGSPRRARVSPLKTDTRSNLPLPRKRTEKITTSPLKSLSKDQSQDTENTMPNSSDQDDDSGTYSNWRKEQLKKLNAARQVANNLNWETDTF